MHTCLAVGHEQLREIEERYRRQNDPMVVTPTASRLEDAFGAAKKAEKTAQTRAATR